MIYINDSISIPEKEIRMNFIRASGPGGQNVNKVSSAVQLRFNIVLSPSLPDDVRKRLKTLAGKRINAEGVLIIYAARFRTQNHNRQDAIKRLIDLIQRAAIKPEKRIKTKPTVASKSRILENKRIQGKQKRLRNAIRDHDQ